MTAICAYVFRDSGRCSSEPFDHVHQPPPCRNGKPERHHDFVAEPPHKHRYDHCVCGLSRKPA